MQLSQVTSALGEVDWFDQSLAHEFYILKGVLALVATCLIVGHMMHTWGTVETLGRRMRYYALLYVSALITFASVEQAKEAELVDYRNLGGLLATVLIIAAMAVSIREDFRKPTERNP